MKNDEKSSSSFIGVDLGTIMCWNANEK